VQKLLFGINFYFYWIGSFQKFWNKFLKYLSWFEAFPF